jgi:hypothetical protein
MTMARFEPIQDMTYKEPNNFMSTSITIATANRTSSGISRVLSPTVAKSRQLTLSTSAVRTSKNETLLRKEHGLTKN